MFNLYYRGSDEITEKRRQDKVYLEYMLREINGTLMLSIWNLIKHETNEIRHAQ